MSLTTATTLPGSILEGPDPDKMKQVVIPAMLQLIPLMKDPSPAVRDTVAWTIGRVCELHPEAAINVDFLVPLVENLVQGLTDVPRVAANVAWVSVSPLYPPPNQHGDVRLLTRHCFRHSRH